MDKMYYEAVNTMEQHNVDREYILGWMGGYLQNPMREEQRLTVAYKAGYSDGEQHNTDNFTDWKQ